MNHIKRKKNLTLDSCRESLITKQKKKIDGLPRINWANPSNPGMCHESLITKQKNIKH